ncbi:MAG: GNAT family N-acetyltransferase, partial [Actinomycetota bacterium]|nr:GNAT family N-acetyltransferase [Actinomycetota bacterium]
MTLLPPPKPSPVPELTDGVVTLREHHDCDVDDIVTMCRDEDFARWTSVPVPYEREHAVGFVRDIVRSGWADGSARCWAIEAPDDDGTPRYAGNLAVRGTPVADIGFGLHPWARGRGLMRRAIGLATRSAFDEGGVAVVHWRAHVGNVASRRTAWACGFTFGGAVPRLLTERGEAVDAWTGWLLPDDEAAPRTTWLESPVLHGERVRLRPWRDEDVARIVESCSDPRTSHWLEFMPSPYTEADARAWLTRTVEQASLGRAVNWALADPATDQVLGSVGAMDISGGEAEVGYWTHPDARGRGAMGGAVRLIVRHAFTPETNGGLGL